MLHLKDSINSQLIPTLTNEKSSIDLKIKDSNDTKTFKKLSHYQISEKVLSSMSEKCTNSASLDVELQGWKSNLNFEKCWTVLKENQAIVDNKANLIKSANIEIIQHHCCLVSDKPNDKKFHNPILSKRLKKIPKKLQLVQEPEIYMSNNFDYIDNNRKYLNYKKGVHRPLYRPIKFYKNCALLPISTKQTASNPDLTSSFVPLKRNVKCDIDTITSKLNKIDITIPHPLKNRDKFYVHINVKNDKLSHKKLVKPAEYFTQPQPKILKCKYVKSNDADKKNDKSKFINSFNISKIHFQSINKYKQKQNSNFIRRFNQTAKIKNYQKFNSLCLTSSKFKFHGF